MARSLQNTDYIDVIEGGKLIYTFVIRLLDIPSLDIRSARLQKWLPR